MNDQSSYHDNSAPNPFGALLDMYKPFIDMFNGAMGSNTDQPTMSFDARGMNDGGNELLTFMASVYRSGLSNGIQYWGRMAEINMRYYPVFADTLSKINAGNESSEQARASLVDAGRAWMREVTEISNQECRKYQAEFEELLINTVMPGETELGEEEYRRYWKAK